MALTPAERQAIEDFPSDRVKHCPPGAVSILRPANDGPTALLRGMGMILPCEIPKPNANLVASEDPVRIEREKLVKKLARQGMARVEIVAETGIPAATVSAICSRLRIHLQKRKPGPKPRSAKA